MDSIFLSLNGKPKLLRTGSGCPLVSLALARNTQKFSIKKPAALRAKLTDKKTGVGNAIQSLSREMNQACIWVYFRTDENLTWAPHPRIQEGRDCFLCWYCANPIGPEMLPAASGEADPCPSSCLATALDCREPPALPAQAHSATKALLSRALPRSGSRRICFSVDLQRFVAGTFQLNFLCGSSSSHALYIAAISISEKSPFGMFYGLFSVLRQFRKL